MSLRTHTSRRRGCAAGTISFRPPAPLSALLILLLLFLIQACSSDSKSVIPAQSQAVPAPRPDRYVPDLGPPWGPSSELPVRTAPPELFAPLAQEYENVILSQRIPPPVGYNALHTLRAPEPDEAWKKKWAAERKAARKKKAPKKPKLTRELAEEQFLSFALRWLEKLNRNYPQNRERMNVKVEGGFYYARFRSADRDTLEIRVKPTESGIVPFVGVLSYLERDYYCMAVTEEQARQGPFHIEKQIKVTEIFSYGKKGWRE